MKISVMVDAEGQIVAAVIRREPPARAGVTATDELRLSEGHKMHELDMPPELENDYLDGKLVETFQHYKLVEEAGKPSLKRASGR